MRNICFTICFSLGAALGQAQALTCADIEAGVEAEVLRVPTAANQLGVFRTIGDEAVAALRQCPQSATLWYLAARSAEVLEGPTNGQAFAEEGGLKKVVGDALAHAGESAPVVTVAARVESSMALARKACALDPRYQPARRALAEILAKEGAFEEALNIAVAKTPSGAMALTRARVLLAARRPAEAAQEARKALTLTQVDELAPSVEIYRGAEEVLGFALLDLKRTEEGRKALRAAAAAGSVAAQRYLAK
jgi:tetratricopeptide (TPR) repeat protein